MLQEFKTRMQSPELTLCVKDVNLLLGHVDSVDTVDFKSLIPKAYGLLSARLAVCFMSDVTQNLLLLLLYMSSGVCWYTCRSVDICMPALGFVI